MVVLPEPLVDDDLSLLRRREPLGVEQLAAMGPVEAFVVSVYPRDPRIDTYGLDPDPGKPGVEVLSDELRTIV